MDRRSFLKGTAGIGTLAALELNLGANAKDIVEGAGVNKNVGSVCEMCSSRCPIDVRVENGKCALINWKQKVFIKQNISLCKRRCGIKSTLR